MFIGFRGDEAFQIKPNSDLTDAKLTRDWCTVDVRHIKLPIYQANVCTGGGSVDIEVDVN